MAVTPDQNGSIPDADAIRGSLGRLLSSKALAGSEQLKRLLRQTVERTLNGEADLLKEYNLGLDVFERPADYDPKVDPIVRVQARRLRAKLDEYYSGEGAADGIAIRLPKGAYVPLFEKQAAAAVPRPSAAPVSSGSILAALSATVALAAAAIWLWSGSAAPGAPSVAVLPIVNLTGDASKQYLADRTTEVLVTELARDPRLRIVSRTSASRYRDTKLSAKEIARELDVQCLMEGGIGLEGGNAYLKLRAVDGVGDRKIWADNFQSPVNQMLPAQTRAARNAADAIVRFAAARH